VDQFAGRCAILKPLQHVLALLFKVTCSHE
jgi:hypothetical protein